MSADLFVLDIDGREVRAGDLVHAHDGRSWVRAWVREVRISAYTGRPAAAVDNGERWDVTRSGTATWREMVESGDKFRKFTREIPESPDRGRVVALEAEVARLQAEVDRLTSSPPSPIMDAVRAQPGLGHVDGTDHDLLLRVLQSREGWEPGVARWSHVRHIARHGSGVGHALCVVIGVDPNEYAPEDDDECCRRCGALLARDEDASDV